MKSIPQLEFGGMAGAFNLAGETIKQAEPKLAARPGNTAPLFSEQQSDGLTFDGEASFNDDRI